MPDVQPATNGNAAPISDPPGDSAEVASYASQPHMSDLPLHSDHSFSLPRLPEVISVHVSHGGSWQGLEPPA